MLDVLVILNKGVGPNLIPSIYCPQFPFSQWVRGWRSGESTRLPPMWLRFNSQVRLLMWVEFVGSLLCTERFSPGTPVFPLLKNQHLT